MKTIEEIESTLERMAFKSHDSLMENDVVDKNTVLEYIESLLEEEGQEAFEAARLYDMEGSFPFECPQLKYKSYQDYLKQKEEPTMKDVIFECSNCGDDISKLGFCPKCDTDAHSY